MAIGVYAGSTASGVTALPSPVSIKPSHEIIWSENTGRAQSGTNRAKMIGDVVAEKKTYAIQWGILTEAQFGQITAKLTAGFFYFAVATTLAAARSAAVPFYRGEIQYEILPVGSQTYYNNVSISVIQQ
jgi:hypothetical protein